MKNAFLFLFLQVLTTCASSKAPLNSETVVYKPKKYSPKVIAHLPPGYIIKRIAAEGDTEYRFQYRDSSVFYISSFITPHSYLEIKKKNAVYSKEIAITQKKELLLMGRDSTDNYWADKTIEGLSIGYYNVRPTSLKSMENAINTLIVNKP